MSEHPNVEKMVSIYMRLFLLLVSVTALGILLSALHMPVLASVFVALSIILFKSSIVYDAFKGLLVGKNILVLVFSMTGIFFLTLLLLPFFNHEGRIVGTVDISKEIQAQEKPMEGHHGH